MRKKSWQKCRGKKSYLFDKMNYYEFILDAVLFLKRERKKFLDTSENVVERMVIFYVVVFFFFNIKVYRECYDSIE